MLSSPESVYLASYRAGYQKQQRLDWRRWQSEKTKSPPPLLLFLHHFYDGTA
jgi:hypothetical protein